ncbi:MAG TPA: alpha-ribazole phosphatase [Methylomusa anaerophila]|uniref:Alpha-ribazole phosphatase n=1 Tax=Methylomusa anaerophila TaxID=1930071 RepID=A0A348AQD2_9FIRM|nr:alpha-ribazole phosphatase [Methylomusa anaerophila]BBB93280.1 phosphoserine phosphatase 1 [Methylomusa anaerophila]HML86889.1 alpha-ribazole phosphatase [Methylomusa anaerophila]
MTRIILVRHGQTIWNVEKKYQGHSDIGLTETGLHQARQVAEGLTKEEIDAVYASDLSRAYKTAEFIAALRGLQVISVPELREIKFGEWEGLTYDQIMLKWPHIMGKLWACPDEVEIPGGETFRQLKARAHAAMQRIVAAHPEETVVVVSHGGTIRTILCAILDIHLNNIWSIRQDNTAVNIIDYLHGRPVVALVNDIHHLDHLDIEE